jgi:multicomponent K+:H+ antiporter subunit D
VTAHLVATPILLPLATAAVMLLIGRRRVRAEAALAIGCSLALIVNAWLLIGAVDGPVGTLAVSYRLGDWPAPFAIVLAADRLSALMLLLGAILGLVSSVFSLSRWSRLGPFYHPLSQLLLMGLNGAFLTGDLFNLFVFFEVLLAASYGLLLHGSGVKRVQAGLHYVVINLVASLLFLVGVSLIFGVTGTLNMAVLATHIIQDAHVSHSLLHAGAAILAVAFLVKAAAWPLGFWLPGAYDAAAPPVAAMFAIMTKVGIYALLRLDTLLFGADAGLSADFGRLWLLGGGCATMAVGMIGVLAARDLGRLGGYNLVVSAGSVMAALGFGAPAITAGALFYLVVSTLGAAMLFLIGGLIASDRGDQFEEPDVLEAFDPNEEDELSGQEESAVMIPAPVGILSAAFLVCTLLVAGIPPLPGFLAKFAMLAPLLAALDGPAAPWAAVTVALVVLSSFCVLTALVTAGIQIWWAEPGGISPTIRITEIAPMLGLVVACLVLSAFPEGPIAYMRRTAAQLHNPIEYIAGVLAPESP